MTAPPTDKWQDLYTADQARWNDAKQAITLVFVIALNLALSVLFASVFLVARANSLGLSSSITTNLIIISSPFIPLIVGIAGLIIIFKSSHRYFKALYKPVVDIKTSKLIMRRIFGVPPFPPPLDSVFHYPFVIAKDGKIDQKDYFIQWLGGPASPVIMDGTALYLERGNQFSRVIGPGVAFLEKNETVRAIVDLRPQTYDGKVKSWTKDGIEVEFRTKIVCRIGNANGTLVVHDLGQNPTNPDGKVAGEDAPIYPYDPICVRKAVEWTKVKRRPTERKADKEIKIVEELVESDWLDGAWGKVQGVLSNHISKHYLEELFVSVTQNSAGQILSAEERDKIQTLLNDSLMKEAGISLLDLQIEKFNVSSDINAKRIEKWKAEWSAKQDVRDAKSSAEGMKAVEKARAEAQRDLILQIADGLSANKDTLTDSVLLTLSDVLEKSSGDPYASTYLVETLEKLREILER